MGFLLGEIARAQPLRGTMAGFAAVVLTAGFLVHSDTLPQSQTYATGTGETRSVSFGDGSQAQLNTRSHLEWFEEDRRAVLHDGEAFFEVTADAAHPFRVKLAQSEIRVLGTRFNVYQKHSGEVVLAVLDGRIQVQGRKGQGGDPAGWQRTLQANQQIVYGPAGVLRDVETTPLAAGAARWREGVLEISDEPLSDVLEELGRYTDQGIVIRDSRLKELRVSGAMSIRNVRAALARLQKLAPITVEDEGGVFTLGYREGR